MADILDNVRQYGVTEQDVLYAASTPRWDYRLRETSDGFIRWEKRTGSRPWSAAESVPTYIFLAAVLHISKSMDTTKLDETTARLVAERLIGKQEIDREYQLSKSLLLAQNYGMGPKKLSEFLAKSMFITEGFND